MSEARLLRLPEVIHQTGLGRSTIYRLVSKKEFPDPIRLVTPAISVWKSNEVQEWIEAASRAGARLGSGPIRSGLRKTATSSNEA